MAKKIVKIERSDGVKQGYHVGSDVAPPKPAPKTPKTGKVAEVEPQDSVTKAAEAFAAQQATVVEPRSYTKEEWDAKMAAHRASYETSPLSFRGPKPEWAEEGKYEWVDIKDLEPGDYFVTKSGDHCQLIADEGDSTAYTINQWGKRDGGEYPARKFTIMYMGQKFRSDDYTWKGPAYKHIARTARVARRIRQADDPVVLVPTQEYLVTGGTKVLPGTRVTLKRLHDGEYGRRALVTDKAGNDTWVSASHLGSAVNIADDPDQQNPPGVPDCGNPGPNCPIHNGACD